MVLADALLLFCASCPRDSPLRFSLQCEPPPPRMRIFVPPPQLILQRFQIMCVGSLAAAFACEHACVDVPPIAKNGRRPPPRMPTRHTMQCG